MNSVLVSALLLLTTLPLAATESYVSEALRLAVEQDQVDKANSRLVAGMSVLSLLVNLIGAFLLFRLVVGIVRYLYPPGMAVDKYSPEEQAFLFNNFSSRKNQS